MAKLSFEELKSFVHGDGIGVRIRQRLQPAGGVGDKIFPPTYATGDKTLKYAVEHRRIEGQDVTCVLLDSVASQANRIEDALQSAWDDQLVNFPVITVDFSGIPDLAEVGTVSTLQAPHRIADAILRDSTDMSGATIFRDTPEGRAFTNATTRNATAVFLLCPTALLLGVWDSTGPKGGLGAKFQRALVSEVTAIGAEHGVKVGSRLDPLGIQANVPIYHRKDNDSDWTIESAEAKLDKGKPVIFSRKGSEGKGKPSAVNHSNIAPTIDKYAGGITCDYAVQTVVLSFPALRKLRFAASLDGQAFADRPAAERGARVALAALGLAGIVMQRDQGYDLRSRCLLVPEGPMQLEVLSGDGTSQLREVTTSSVRELLERASKEAEKVGLAWNREPIRLKPAPKLAALIKRSREEAAAGAEVDGV